MTAWRPAPVALSVSNRYVAVELCEATRGGVGDDVRAHPGACATCSPGCGTPGQITARSPAGVARFHGHRGPEGGHRIPLYAYLSTHPDIFPAAQKEIHYFDMHYSEGEHWYRAMFPTRRRIAAAARDDGRRIVTGEAAPTTCSIHWPRNGRRARCPTPDSSCCCVIRSNAPGPTTDTRCAGREQLSFADALAAEPQRLAGAEAALRAGLANAATLAHRTLSYLARGRYAQQLSRWLEHYPRESLLVVQAEDLFAEPVREFSRVVGHLGVAPMAEPRFDVYNAGRPTRSIRRSGHS